MATFITKLPSTGTGVRVAVKDIIDMAGVPTTCASRVVADQAEPAKADAACMAELRRQETAGAVRFVGKTNLHELAYGTTGRNPWYGTPVNPLDPGLVPGGSSSGSAVAVALDDADIALGTDTGGSVRIPAACCGIAGLKTTHGRVPLTGVWPLAPSLDTIGPMALDVAGLVAGMQLLEPGFAVAPSAPTTVGRFRGLDTHPAIEAAIDEALAAAEFDVVDIDLPGWGGAHDAARALLAAEAWLSDRALYERDKAAIGPDVRARLEHGRDLPPGVAGDSLAHRRLWREELTAVLQRVELIALPTLVRFPPALDEDATLVTATAALNLAGFPALALPVPTGGRLPASLQLVAADNGEAALLAAGAVVERAVADVTV